MSISVETALNQVGFVNIKKKANTLQGTVFKALNKFTNQNIVIKTCNKSLHKNKLAEISGEKYVAVQEDIISEAAITKYITESEGVPKSIAKFYDFFQCNHNYYLVMEDAGDDLFDFVVKAHRLIQMGTIDIFEWHKVVKVILKKMIEAIEFIHSKNVCHFDISLENFLINDVEINCFQRENKPPKMQFVLENIEIKLIDFGLAEKFDEKDNFTSTKWCGKSVYKSPEIISKSAFDAKSNDIWCMGVCLWMLCMGVCPWNKACVNDELFVLIMNGCVLDVLRQWNKMNYVNTQLIDLFGTFFQYEDERKCLDQIKQHPWLQ